ncbi:MAG: pyridoxal-phosphate dependent enzyme [Candidatus Uhrbacteria bacterium]
MSLTLKEEKILNSIVVASENDPNKPEFPPDDPRFPATPTYQIKVPGFNDVWLKDESINPTGTHKDRMAWEMVVTYKQLLKAKANGSIKKLPQFSIISSGSAANAIQQMLKKYNLPDLKALLDFRVEKRIKNSLEKIGCEIFETDLSKKILTAEDILNLTNNPDGIDITSDDSLGPYSIFYDWMSYEILNQAADYIFVPYGTGNLYENIANIAVKESRSLLFHDKRLKVPAATIKKSHLLGATTNNPLTKADKLFSSHLPFVHFDTHWIKLAVKNGYLGNESNVYNTQEKFFDQAMMIAKENQITCEPSGIAGLALMLQISEHLPKNKKMLIINTGETKLA